MQRDDNTRGRGGEDDEPEDLDERWTGEQTQDETEDQAVDQTRDRTLDQNRGPTGNQDIDPTRFRAKDEEETVIDPMAEAKSDDNTDDETPVFKNGDPADARDTSDDEQDATNTDTDNEAENTA